MEKDKISIVVPVYNTNIYLRECLDSLVNQNYPELEIICINDGSTDSSLAILNEYAAKDGRIQVIDKQNEGVSATRKCGITAAEGEYLMFVDSDDWLELDACQVLIDLMHQYQPDVVMFSYYREYKNKTLRKQIYPENLILFDDDQCRQLHRRHAGIIGKELSEPQNSDAICSLSTKLFRTKIFKDNEIEFIDINTVGSYEDGLVNLNYYEYVHKAVFTNRCLYHYRKYNATSQTTAYKEDFPQKWNHLYDIIQQYIDEHHCSPDFQEGLENRIALGSIGLGLNELNSKKSIRGKMHSIREILTEERYHDAVIKMDISCMPVHWKVFFFACKKEWVFLTYMLLVMISVLKSKV